MENVVVVDGMITAILVSILFKDKEIDNLIIEQKLSRTNVDQWVPSAEHQLMIDLILTNLKVKNRYIITVPCIMYYSLTSLVDIHRLFWARHRIKKDLRYYIGEKYKLCTYYGSVTSSIIYFANYKNIVYLDHGSEYINRLKETEKISFFRFCLRGFVKVLKMFLSIHEYRSVKRGFTLFSGKNDYFTHVSFLDFDSPVLSKFLESYVKNYSLLNKEETALFLPFTSRDYNVFCYARKQKIDLYDSEAQYNKIVTDLKVKGIKNLYIKFHPGLYVDDVELATIEFNKIVSICKKHGLECIHIGDMDQLKLLAALPAELLLKYFNVGTVVAQSSTAVFNIADSKSDYKVYLYHATLPKNVQAEVNMLNEKNEYIRYII